MVLVKRRVVRGGLLRSVGVFAPAHVAAGRIRRYVVAAGRVVVVVVVGTTAVVRVRAAGLRESAAAAGL